MNFKKSFYHKISYILISVCCDMFNCFCVTWYVIGNRVLFECFKCLSICLFVLHKFIALRVTNYALCSIKKIFSNLIILQASFLVHYQKFYTRPIINKTTFIQFHGSVIAGYCTRTRLTELSIFKQV